jgi:hypothetical protein
MLSASTPAVLCGSGWELNVGQQVEAESNGQDRLEELEDVALGVHHVSQAVHHDPGRKTSLPSGRSRRTSPSRTAIEFSFRNAGLAHDLVEDPVGIGRRSMRSRRSSRTDWRRLVVVADEDDAGARQVDGLEEVPSERHIDHRDLVDDDDVGLDRLLRRTRERLPLKPAAGGA